MTENKSSTEKYFVRAWKDYGLLQVVDNLAAARRIARRYGHTGETGMNPRYYEPVAYVADENHYLIYNPIFKRS